MVHVVAGAVGQHRVDQVGLYLRCHRVQWGEAAYVDRRGLIHEVPTNPGSARTRAGFGPSTQVGIDQKRRG